MSAQASLVGPEVSLGIAGEDTGDIVARSPTALFWRRFRQDRVAVASLAFIAVLAIVAIAAPLVVKLLGLPGPYVQNLNLTNAFGEPLGPSAAHPFGVDGLGEDIASRVIYGARVSLEVGVIGTGSATVIGVSADDIATQKKFSTQECRSAFLVASDPGLTIAKSYDAILTQAPQYANRISYVIAPNGTIVYSYSSLDPSLHVQNTLNALRALNVK